jgi:hypothetical protein
MTQHALQIVAERVLKRPAILECTRLVGFTDAEIARIFGIGPMVVSEWIGGKRAIPRVRHQALALFVYALARFYHGDLRDAPRTAHALRARLLFKAINPLLEIAIAECGEVHPYEPPEDPNDDWEELAPAWFSDEAEAMAKDMLERLRAVVVK